MDQYSAVTRRDDATMPPVCPLGCRSAAPQKRPAPRRSTAPLLLIVSPPELISDNEIPYNAAPKVVLMEFMVFSDCFGITIKKWRHGEERRGRIYIWDDSESKVATSRLEELLYSE